MDICPFWSGKNKLEYCTKECPMASANEECIFLVHHSENNLIEDLVTNKELDN